MSHKILVGTIPFSSNQKIPHQTELSSCKLICGIYLWQEMLDPWLCSYLYESLHEKTYLHTCEWNASWASMSVQYDQSSPSSVRLAKVKWFCMTKWKKKTKVLHRLHRDHI